jgi:hypothetical protein
MLSRLNELEREQEFDEERYGKGNAKTHKSSQKR